MTTEAPTYVDPKIATEFVLAFPPAPDNVADPESCYRVWLAKHRFPLVHRTRLFAQKHTLSWHEVVDPTDGEIIGKMEQTALGIEVKLNVRTVNVKTGQPGCNMRDTFKGPGDLKGNGPWKLTRVSPCRKGCPACVAPGECYISRV